MKTRSKLVGGAAVVVALGMALVGCSDPSTATSGSSSTVTWNSPTASLKGVSLTMWSAQSTATIANSVVKDFDAATGADVKVVVVPDTYESNVATKLATGDTPDLMFWGATQAGLTQIQASTKLQSLDGAPWLSKLNSQYKDLGTLNGKHYAALYSGPDTIGVYYNKQNFTKAGITTPPTDWAGFEDDLKKLKAAGVAAPYFEAGGDKWTTQNAVLPQLSDAAAAGFWTNLNKNKASFSDPEIVSVIKDYQSIFTGGLANSDYKTATFADQGTALYNGTAGMEYQIGALVTEMLASHSVADVNSRIGYFPLGRSSAVGSYALGVSNTVVAFKTGDAKKEAAARQMLSWWLGPDYANFIKAQNFVSIQSGVDTPAGIPQATIDAANVKQVVGSMQQQAIANPDLYLNLADMLYGTKTPEQVAADTQSQFVQLAKAQGAAGF